MFIPYLLKINQTSLLRNPADDKIPFNNVLETFRTMLMNEARYPNLPKAIVHYHHLSKAYEISIPGIDDMEPIDGFSVKIEQGFYCEGNFVSLPQETIKTRLSILGIVVVGCFAALISIVISAPSVIGLKILSGLKIVINWVRNQEEKEADINPDIDKKTDGSHEFKTKCVEYYTYMSFLFAYGAFFIIGEVVLSYSDIISIREPYKVNRCAVMVPDAEGRKLLTANQKSIPFDQRLNNSLVLRSLLHHLNNNPLWLENMSDNLSDSASYNTEKIPNAKPKTTIEVGCEGGVLISGDVKWRLYAPFENAAGEMLTKKWESLGYHQIHQCGSDPQTSNTVDGVTYNVIYERTDSGWVKNDGCGLFTHSFSNWRLLGRLIRNYNVATVTKIDSQHSLSAKYPGKWILERVTTGFSETREYMIEGINNSFTVNVRNNNTWGNFRMSDGVYVFNSKRFYADNRPGNIRNRWCLFPPDIGQAQVLYSNVFTTEEMSLIDYMQDEVQNLMLFQKTYPRRVRDRKPWDVATSCFGGELVQEKPCVAELSFNTESNWTEFLPPCNSVDSYTSGPRVYFSVVSDTYCSIRVVNNPEYSAPISVRLRKNEDDYIIGAKYVSCNTHANSSMFGECDNRDVELFQALHPRLVEQTQRTQVVDHGTESSTGWSLFGELSMSSTLIAAGIAIISIFLVILIIKCGLPCQVLKCITSCIHKNHKYEDLAV